MIDRLLRLLLAIAPLALGLMFLRLMPDDVQTPLLLGPSSIPRLDPLGMVGIVLLGLGAARPRPTIFQTFRQSLGIVLAGFALLPVPPVLRLALLCTVSVVLFDELGRDWYLAFLALAAASLAPAMAVPALIVAAFVGVRGYQNAPGHTAKAVYSPFRGAGGSCSLLLRPFWLVTLLRSLADGPWSPQWTVVVPLVGIAAALWHAGRALAVDDRRAGFCRLSAAILLLGFATTGFGTTLGVAAVLWIVMMHSILLLWYDDTEAGSKLVPMVTLFVAAWWTAAAAAGARTPVLSGVAWLVGMAGGAATLLGPYTSGRKGAAVWRQRLLILLLVVAGAASGALTRFAAEPVTAEVGAGLSAFGLLDVRPWIGTAGLDPAHRRVAALPVAPLLPLLLVLAAIVWLLRGLWLRRGPGQSAAQPPAADRARALWWRVWWLPGGGDG